MIIKRRNQIRFSIMVASIFICVLLLIPINTQSANEKRLFKGDQELTQFEYIISMEEDEDFAVEASGYFSIPTHRGDIKNASLDIFCTADTEGNHLLNPKLDIGLDDDYEWMFSGKGYGKAGQQNEFTNGRTKSIANPYLQQGGYFDNRTAIYLPKGSTVTSASMKLLGGPGKYKEDLAVAITYYGEIYYTKSNGGTFNEGVKFFTDVSPYYHYGIGLGDFDNDNDLDLVTGMKQYGSTANAEILMYKNTGGTGNPPWQTIPIKVGDFPTSNYNYIRDFAVEDFDNDGNLDFVVSDTSTFHYFQGNGDLSFVRKDFVGSFGGSSPYGKDAADFNNDGNPDFVSGSSSANIYYFEGKGDGTFKNSVPVPSGTTYGYQYMVVAGDFNGDSNQDFISKYYYDPMWVKGDGDGTFQDPVRAGLSAYGYAPGDNYDFNYDGKQDIVCISQSTSYPYTFYMYNCPGYGDGSFGFSLIGDLGSGYKYTYSVASPPKMPLGGCENLTLNIGDDGGLPEFNYYGTFNSEKTVYFANELNALLGSSRAEDLYTFIDGYGNEMVKIPIRFDSDTFGSVMVHSLDIKYQYTAKVDLIPPNRNNLTTDLNDLLPTNDDIGEEAKVYFALYAETPGKAVISNLNLEFNGAPTKMPIGNTAPGIVKVKEDTDTKVLDLTSGLKQGDTINYFFTDDYDSRDELTFGVFSNSDPEHINLKIDDKWLWVNCSIVKDWYGSAKASVWAMDTEGIKTVSDEFEIIVEPVNDLPKVNNQIPNVNMLENQTLIHVDLDAPKKAYFIDVDSETLYYRAVLEFPDENENKLTVEVLNQLNEIKLTSIGNYGRNIGVIVYCHDNKELLTWSRSELELLECYQMFYVNITSRTRSFPPQWLPMEIPKIPEDTPQDRILKLKNYVTDEDDKITNLTFSIYSLTQSGYIDIILDEETTDISIYPRDNFDGTAYVTFAVIDDDQNRALKTLPIEIIPSNDRPVVKISEPLNGSKIKGIVEVIGSAYDPEDELTKVEISIGDSGDWVPVNGLEYWTYNFDVTNYPTTITQVIVKVRAEDATSTQSLMDKVYLKINRLQLDTDGDGVPDFRDKFKNNPSEWSDTDGDGVGDNSDQFPEDVTQWIDTDGDGYGDNPEGNKDDRFPYDPTQWADTDGDNHGDNEWGNNGDYFKLDPDRWRKEESEEATTEKGFKIYGMDSVTFIMWTVLGMIIILCLVILINYGIKSRKKY